VSERRKNKQKERDIGKIDTKTDAEQKGSLNLASPGVA
jgi:hypothetical protein